MSSLKTCFSKNPVLSVIAMALMWLMLLLVFAGIATTLLNKEYGSPATIFVAHTVMIIGLLILLWRLDWLKPAGIARPGKPLIWLIAVLAMLYAATAALYAFYGKCYFDFSNLKDFPASPDIIKSQLVVCMDEEFFFRGIIMYILILNSGGTIKGRFGGVIGMSVMFGLMHVLWVFFSGLSGLSALFLALQAIIISVWWAALVLSGGSIWPAFVAHFGVNTIIALQGLSHSILQPDHYSYGKFLLFTIPLGLIAIWLILRSSAVRTNPSNCAFFN
jgi:membrane protease YdiL (CAAX protease family)